MNDNNDHEKDVFGCIRNAGYAIAFTILAIGILLLAFAEWKC